MTIDITNPPELLSIGRKGENIYRSVAFDCSEWFEDYPNGTITIVYKRPNGTAYPVVTAATSSPVTWNVSSTDTLYSGFGKVEARLISGSVIGKSCVIKVRVFDSITSDAAAPTDGSPDWITTASSLQSQIGDLDDLETTTKTNLVAAINEAAESGGSSANAVLYTAQTLTDSQKTQARTNIGAAASGEVSESTAMPKVFFTGDITGMSHDDEKIVKIEYFDGKNDFTGYAKMKWQGNSSLSYAKKNFTVKLYSDSTATTKKKVNLGWGNENKYVLKANYIDHSHARNIVSARLWSDIVASRSDYASLPQALRESPNNGAIDGYPFKLYMNGTYQGLYTWNIPKDGWLFNMDDEVTTEAAYCSDGYTSGCFRGTGIADWTLEFPDTAPAAITTSLTAAVDFVRNSTDAQFKANLSNYFDVNSLIDYYIFGVASCGLDGFGKNQILMTYDGTHWLASMYDMDSTWGLWWNGSQFVAYNYARSQFQDYTDGDGNLLYERLEDFFVTEIKARYTVLRSGALSLTNIIRRFEAFTDLIPQDLYDEDGTIYAGIPLQNSNNIKQIRSYAVSRAAYVDSYIDSLVEPVPCTGISLDQNTLTFSTSATQTLTATATPSGTTDAVTWSTSDATKATVANGVVTPVANGSCTITVTCGSYSATCAVTVDISSLKPCTGITLNTSTLTFSGTGSQTLTATPTPSDTTDTVVWSTSAAAVATVSGGVVTAVGNGSATITATCGSYSATCSVTVSGITAKPLATATWLTGQEYNDSGEIVSSNLSSCTEKFQLEDGVLYRFVNKPDSYSGNTYGALREWDENGTYVRKIVYNGDYQFVADGTHYYGVNFATAAASVRVDALEWINDLSGNLTPDTACPTGYTSYTLDGTQTTTLWSTGTPAGLIVIASGLSATAGARTYIAPSAFYKVSAARNTMPFSSYVQVYSDELSLSFAFDANATGTTVASIQAWLADHNITFYVQDDA